MTQTTTKPSVNEEPTSGADQEPAGRVEFDKRGKAVWRWARELLDSTSILLKRLENADLALEPTRKVPVMQDPNAQRRGGTPQELSLSAAEGRDSGGGFDPYNSGR